VQVLTPVQGRLAQQATVVAYQDRFMPVIPLWLASMPLVWLLPRP
jgi:hypothetical protein